MGEPVSLLEFVKLLLDDDAERAHYAADPHGTLADHGLGGLSPADVHDAVAHAQDTLTVDWAQAYGAGAAPAHPPVADPTADPMASSMAPDWWSAEPPDPVTEPDDAPPPPPVPDVDDALFDAPDLHLGH